MYRFITDFLFALKFAKGTIWTKAFYTDEDHYTALLKTAKGCAPSVRNLLAKGFKKFRHYKVDTGKIYAKAFYIKFHKRNPESFKALYEATAYDWITVIDSRYPGKGEGYNDYYVERHNPPSSGTFRVKRPFSGSEHIRIHNGFNEYYCHYAQCRKATKEEIYWAKIKYRRQMVGRIVQQNKSNRRMVADIRKDYYFLKVPV